MASIYNQPRVKKTNHAMPRAVKRTSTRTTPIGSGSGHHSTLYEQDDETDNDNKRVHTLPFRAVHAAKYANSIHPQRNDEKI